MIPKNINDWLTYLAEKENTNMIEKFIPYIKTEEQIIKLNELKDLWFDLEYNNVFADEEYKKRFFNTCVLAAMKGVPYTTEMNYFIENLKEEVQDNILTDGLCGWSGWLQNIAQMSGNITYCDVEKIQTDEQRINLLKIKYVWDQYIDIMSDSEIEYIGQLVESVLNGEQLNPDWDKNFN